MSYTIEIRQDEPRPLAVVRRQARQGELSRVVPAACGEVWAAVKASGFQGAGRHVAIYWDGVINLEVGVEVASPFPGHGSVVPSATPGGTIATTAHIGPYGRLGDAHAAIQAWCAAHGHSTAGPQWEIYGHPTADPAETRTDVFYLLEPAPGQTP